MADWRREEQSGVRFRTCFRERQRKMGERERDFRYMKVNFESNQINQRITIAVDLKEGNKKRCEFDFISRERKRGERQRVFKTHGN